MKNSRLYRLGLLCSTRPWRVVSAWLVAAVLAGALAATWGAELTDDIQVPGSEAERGLDLIGEHYPGLNGAGAILVFHDPAGGRVTDPQSAAAVAASLEAVAGLEGVAAVTDPQEQPAQFSSDADTVYSDVIYDRPVGDVGTRGAADLGAALEPARNAGLEAFVGGELAFATSGAETGVAELVGLAVAVVVLFVVFGTAVAAGLPLLMALVTLGITLAGVFVAASVSSVASEAPQIAAMIGLGVGIDYALILLTRYREELRGGQPVAEAAARATATAGRSVLFAGGTVVVSVCALFLTGIPLVVSLGATAAVVVAVAVLAALTLLPALLRLAGHRVERRRERRSPGQAVPAPASPSSGAATSGAADARDDEGFWAGWTRRIERRPLGWMLAAVASLVVLAVPLGSIELSMPDGRSTAEGTSARQAYDVLAAEFGPGANGPVFVVAETAGDAAAGADRLGELIAADPGIARVSPPVPARDGQAVLFQAVPTTPPSAVATQDTVDRLRAAVAAADPTGAATAVTGSTAVYVDLTSALENAMPIVVGVIVVLSALLLLLLFRSVAVALTAGVMNVLSIAAAFGVLVAVFQWGWGIEVFGLDEPSPIASFAPIFLFAIVFGLSMDYEVFIIARIREEAMRSGDTILGLTRGMARTAHVITSAALIMVSVFVAFAFAHEPLLKLLGLGLAVAVALDATVVRLILVPATIALLGQRIWWIPAWLDRALPAVDVEAEEDDRVPAGVAAHR